MTNCFGMKKDVTSEGAEEVAGRWLSQLQAKPGSGFPPQPPWTLCLGQPCPPPFPLCHAGDSALRHPPSSWLGVCPKALGREEHAGEWSGKEPEAGQGLGEGAEKTVLSEIPDLRGPAHPLV